ncbi:hypothetical protein PCE1_001945 [Barthelona sp. PCE]
MSQKNREWISEYKKLNREQRIAANDLLGLFGRKNDEFRELFCSAEERWHKYDVSYREFEMKLNRNLRIVRSSFSDLKHELYRMNAQNSTSEEEAIFLQNLYERVEGNLRKIGLCYVNDFTDLKQNEQDLEQQISDLLKHVDDIEQEEIQPVTKKSRNNIHSVIERHAPSTGSKLIEEMRCVEDSLIQIESIRPSIAIDLANRLSKYSTSAILKLNEESVLNKGYKLNIEKHIERFFEKNPLETNSDDFYDYILYFLKVSILNRRRDIILRRWNVEKEEKRIKLIEEEKSKKAEQKIHMKEQNRLRNIEAEKRRKQKEKIAAWREAEERKRKKEEMQRFKEEQMIKKREKDAFDKRRKLLKLKLQAQEEEESPNTIDLAVSPVSRPRLSQEQKQRIKKREEEHFLKHQRLRNAKKRKEIERQKLEQRIIERMHTNGTRDVERSFDRLVSKTESQLTREKAQTNVSHTVGIKNTFIPQSRAVPKWRQGL